MILQALDGYYDRLAESGEDGVPLFGFARQKVHFCLVIDREGRLALDPQSLCTRDKTKKLAVEMIVPEPAKRSSGIAPNFLCDNTGYVLGNDSKESSNRAAGKFQAFKNLHHEIGDGVEDVGMAAVIRFLDNWVPADAPKLPGWEEMAGQNLVFRLLDDEKLRYVHERPKVREAWLKHHCSTKETSVGMCLVRGEEGPVARLHPAIKGVLGAQSSGAALVSFNLEAFKSYGKDQNLNAPVGEKSAFSYTTALNWLLRKESRQKIRIGETTVVFWAERKSVFEDIFADLLAPSEDESGEAGDSSAVRYVRAILEAARDGRVQNALPEPDTLFYVLGLSPNASRLSVRFWLQGTVEEITSRVCRHLKQLQIAAQYSNDPEYMHPPVWRLLRETAPLGKSEAIPPLLTGAFMRAVLSGEPYPPSLLTSILIRIRADQNVNRLRAGLIKAFLIRNQKMEVTVSLDKDNQNTGYRLGRLFAVLEAIQEKANRGISSTIRDKYFGSASASPRAVFPILLSLSQKHLSKLRKDEERKGLYYHFDRNVEDIVTGLSAEPLPSFLKPEDQGLFAIGYYHQRKSLYTARETSIEEEA